MLRSWFWLALHLAATAGLPEMPSPSTSLTVEACDKPGSGLSCNQKNALTSRGFTKCCFGAFNVLVTGTSDYPDAYVLTACVTVAELLDQNKDGVADDPAVVAKLSFLEAGGSAPVLQGAPTQAQESEGDALAEDGFAYGFSLQTWKCADGGCGHEVARKIITEEAFHMITQFGYSQAYPAQMGMDDFTSSIACREMAAAECVYWMHPENTCPNPGSHSQPPLVGTCNDAGCDCVEWFHQVILILAGQEPGWMGDSIPRSLDGLRATLSSEFLEMVADPAYHQLQAPLTYTYLLSNGAAYTATPKATSAGGCDDEDSGAGMIIGIVIGVVAVVLLIAGVVGVVMHMKKKKAASAAAGGKAQGGVALTTPSAVPLPDATPVETKV